MRLSVTEHETVNGLLVAEQPADGEAVLRLLKQHDPALRLGVQFDDVYKTLRWEVLHWNGPDRDASFVCAWQTADGEPLPLSTRLLDKVQLLDRRTRGEPATPETLNAELRQRNARDTRAQFDAVTDEHRPYIDRGRVSVSMSDATTSKPGWQRTRRPSKGDSQ